MANAYITGDLHGTIYLLLLPTPRLRWSHNLSNFSPYPPRGCNNVLVFAPGQCLLTDLVPRETRLWVQPRYFDLHPFREVRRCWLPQDQEFTSWLATPRLVCFVPKILLEAEKLYESWFIKHFISQ